MEAGYYELNIYRGAAVSKLLRFVNPETEEPYDLTGLSPFKWQVRDKSQGPLLVDGTVEDVSLTEGLIRLTASAELTEGLCPHTSQCDLLDATGEKWIYGPCIIGTTITQLS